MQHIPVYQPLLSGNEKRYVLDCLDSTWISSKGKYVTEFEQKFAQYISMNHAASVTNGTVAIHLALMALGVGPGDEVIVPTLTYIASVNAIRYTGATPVFADSDKEYWQLDPKGIKLLITPQTKAIMPVHLYGGACDMPAIMEIAKEYNLFVIEDCAEAIGTKCGNRMVGSFGDIAAYSFFGNKTITTGEGGMVLTNDETLYNRCLHLKGQGLAKYRQYWHDIIGYNYRMTNICAAIGLAQLENIESVIVKKRQIAIWYWEYLKGNNHVQTHGEREGTFHTYWMCSILVDNPEDRDLLRDYLDGAGIETRPLFYPVHTMPMYSEKYRRFNNAEWLGWRGINLPSYPELTEELVKNICDTINSFYSNR
ncbi:GDP-perosamine synthase [Spirochaetia bacterium]|nr:GDP-perosamine synthase [Spirochaetia bacterium]